MKEKAPEIDFGAPTPAKVAPWLPGMHLVIRQRAGAGKPAATEEVDWPASWPLPAAGSTVLAGELAGWVEFVEFDLRSGRISVVLR